MFNLKYPWTQTTANVYCMLIVHEAQDVTENTKNAEHQKRIKMSLGEMSCGLIEMSHEAGAHLIMNAEGVAESLIRGDRFSSFRLLRPTLRWNLKF